VSVIGAFILSTKIVLESRKWWKKKWKTKNEKWKIK
jgi:hypothetical protein